jgi:Cu(I)/Ag(I) efflux system membrane fusion protein
MNKQALVVALLTLAMGAGGGYWLAVQKAQRSGPADSADLAQAERKVLFYRNPMNPEITSPVPAQDEMGMDYLPVYAEEPAVEPEPEILFYRNPMNPEITSPVPAQDEMGMDYIPVYADTAGAGRAEPAGTVQIDPVTVQNIGVRTARAEQRVLSRTIRAVGRVDYDEEHLARLHPKIEGWIEELFIDKTGEQIAKDAMLLNIYSPQLVTSQQEYLLALNSRDVLKSSPYKEIRQGAEELARSARERLELLDVPEHQIRELETTRKIKKNLHIHSPFDGVIVKIGARKGEYVTPQTELYMIADLSTVWVYADVYENDLPWIATGDPVEMQLAGIPGRTFTGRVAYVYPYAEAKTRTIKVRMVFDNPGLLLKPAMFADVSILAQRQVDAVVIPAEAVVRSGEREQVFLVRGPGKFEPREVALGVSSQGLVQVLEGVETGEEVVTSSQFLIDSESKLREATAKMLETMSERDAAQEGGAGDEAGR